METMHVGPEMSSSNVPPMMMGRTWASRVIEPHPELPLTGAISTNDNKCRLSLAAATLVLCFTGVIAGNAQEGGPMPLHSPGYWVAEHSQRAALVQQWSSFMQTLLTGAPQQGTYEPERQPAIPSARSKPPSNAQVPTLATIASPQPLRITTCGDPSSSGICTSELRRGRPH